MFYDRFLKLCQNRGITPYRFSQDTGVGQSTISMWKKNNATPSGETLAKIADYFDTTINYLLGLGDDSTESDKRAEGHPASFAQSQEDISIEDRADQILSGLTDSKSGTLMLDGKPASAQAIEAFRNAVMVGIEIARKVNRDNQEKEGGAGSEDGD